MALVQVMAGQKILYEGRPSTATYLIISGEVELFTAHLGTKRKVAYLGSGDILGEVEVLTGATGILSALAVKDCTLLPVPNEEFARHLAETDPMISYILKLMAQRLSNMTHEFTHSQLTRAGQRPLPNLSLVASEFRFWTKSDDFLQNASLERRCRSGENIFEAGEPSDYAYILLEGEAEVLLPDHETQKLIPLAKIGVGELFGEMALIERRPRSATIVALTTCRLLRVEGEQINKRLAHGDPLLDYWMQSVLKRMRHMQKLLKAHISPHVPVAANLLSPEPLPETARLNLISDFQAADELRHLVASTNLEKAATAVPLAGHRLNHVGKLDYVLTPIVRFGSHEVEALRIRPIWRHPAHGIIQARRIYALAQKMWLEPGLDVAIADFCSQYMPQIWKGRRLFTLQPDPLMLVIPVRSKLDDNPAVTAALRELAAKLPHDRLILELEEERLAIGNPENTKRMLTTWRDLGFRLMLSYSDGESGMMQMLRRNPIDYLRLRPELTERLLSGDDPQMTEKLSAGLHRFSEGNGLKVWADGIASPDWESKLRRLGVEAASGALYSRHMTLNETVTMMVEKRTLTLTPVQPTAKAIAESR